jgi:hypothetical protein
MTLRAICVLAFIAILSSCQKPEWVVVSPGDGASSISMPGSPKEATQKVNTPAGDIDVHTFIFEQSEVAYSIIYSDFPDALIASRDTEKMLDGARDGAISSVKGTLTAETKITLAEFPGRELKIEAPDGKHTVVSRVYLVKNRLYQVAVATPKDASVGDDVAKFFSSFKLLRT